ncbi:MAG TPA: ABC transporter ATP-binding protein [Acidobacteria bacterium]|nr:ABC transporter ATP-binding protein [Acidobacteriota bacterium]
MTTLDRLRVRGYRRLYDVDLAMKPFSVLIGTNGSGKTSFLEVLSLLSASCNAQLSARLSELGGIGDILTRDKAEAIEVDLSSPVKNQKPLHYGFRLEPRGQGYWLQREALTQERNQLKPFKHIEAENGDVRYFDTGESKLLRPEWAFNAIETALAQVPKMFREPEELRQTLAGTAFYASLDVGPRSPVRLPQQMRPASLPGSQGEDLVSCLYSLRETDPDRFEILEDTLAAAFPDFERLAFPPAAAGMLSMTWKDRNYSKPMYMHQLSEGTLRFLWLATLLGSRDLPPITLLDEPEVSLHPELQSLLVELMREASARSQIIVATHSDRLVRFLQPEELLVVETENGEARLTWANEMEIEDWLADYSLDELWRTRRLGAVP